jgi:hypothetical protein
VRSKTLPGSISPFHADEVAVLDLHELEVVAHVPVGDTPNGISFSTAPVRAQAAVTIDVPQVGGGTDKESESHDDHGDH